MQYRSASRSSIATSVARRARAESSRDSSPPERQPAQWRLRACHVNAGCASEVTARTSHHSLAPKQRALLAEQCFSVVRRPITTSAARRARSASSHVLQPPERQPVQWRFRSCHVNTGCALEVTARASHHSLASKGTGLLPVQCPSKVHRLTTSSAVRRARAARLLILPPPERQPAQ